MQTTKITSHKLTHTNNTVTRSNVDENWERVGSSGDFLCFPNADETSPRPKNPRSHARQQVVNKTTSSKGKGVVGGPKLETVTPPLPPKPQVRCCIFT